MGFISFERAFIWVYAYKISGQNNLRWIFRIFHFLVLKFVSQQDSSEENVNNLTYWHQNLVGPKRFENRLVEQNPYKIWDQNDSNWNFGGFLN